jgi:hypothetical protein
LVLSEWILQNRFIFERKVVVEIGENRRSLLFVIKCFNVRRLWPRSSIASGSRACIDRRCYRLSSVHSGNGSTKCTSQSSSQFENEVLSFFLLLFVVSYLLHLPLIRCSLLDWEEICEDRFSSLSDGVALASIDLFIGSDLVYSRPIGALLGRTIAKLLQRCRGARFYGVMQSSRDGFTDLIETLREASIAIEQRTLHADMRPDLQSDLSWTLLQCWCVDG